MDRRAALRRLGGLGTGAVAASMVTSSPAFAYDAPSNPTGATPELVVFTNDRIGFRAVGNDFGTAACPASAVASSTQWVSWTVNVISSNPGAVFQLGRFGGWWLVPMGSTLTNGVYRAGFRIRKYRPRSWLPGDSFAVDLVIRYTCTYSDGTVTTLDHVQNWTITKGPGAAGVNDWTIVAV